MNRRHWIAIVLVGMSQGCHVARPASESSVRILTYNIHHGQGNDGRVDLERTARVINAAHPDIVALQEIDIRTDRVGGVDSALELGRLTRMNVTFGKAIDYANGEYGLALLSNGRFSNCKIHLLPGDPKKEKRIAFSATLDLGNKAKQLRVVVTHLDHTGHAPDRVVQAQELNNLFAGGEGPPTILAGDFNATPDSAPYKLLTRFFTDTSARSPTPTFPADLPTRQIDFVFVRDPALWRLADSVVIDDKITSDHRPLLVELVRLP